MGEVYSLAAETIVYSGAELPTTALAMDLWRRLEAILDSMPRSQIEGEPLQIAPQKLLDKSGTTWGGSKWTALCEPLTHPWFGRLWTIQEAVLSGTLLFVCGRFLLAWQDLVKLRDLVKYAGIEKIVIDVGGSRAWTSVSTVSRIAMLKENRAGANLGWQAGLSFILYNGDAAVASDPRDHINGVLGLIHDTRSVRDRDEIQINYHDSTAKVFTNATADGHRGMTALTSSMLVESADLSDCWVFHHGSWTSHKRYRNTLGSIFKPAREISPLLYSHSSSKRETCLYRCTRLA